VDREDLINEIAKLQIPGGKGKNLGRDSIRNLQIFKDGIHLDIQINNPTLSYKNSLKNLCSEAIEKLLKKKIKLNITFHIIQQDKIKGNPIPGVKNIIAICSGKGGVGKSTLTANIATSLADLGYKVGIIDADIYGPSMHIMFGLEGKNPQAVNVEGKSKIKPLENYGVKILSIGFFSELNQAIVWRGPMASKALNQMIWDASWGELDFLLVDLPPGTGDIHLSLVQSIPVTGAIVASTPQKIALADARKAISMFQMESIAVPILGIIENMSYFSTNENPDKKHYIFGKEGAKKLAKEMNIALLGEIPLVQSLRESADSGKPILFQGATFIAKSFIHLSENIVSAVNERNKKEGTTIVPLTHKKGC
tara:strand:- start:22 stop:1119 length:1098 start_codon:yes stop_codon:yes gene_type:complete